MNMQLIVGNLSDSTAHWFSTEFLPQMAAREPAMSVHFRAHLS